MGGVGAVACTHFLVEGTYVCVLVDGAGSLLWSAVKCPVVNFGGAYGLGKALGRSSFNVQGCGPVLLEN